MVSLIMGIVLGYLYLIERQKIYGAIKESSRNLIEQEQTFYEQIGSEWDKNIKRLMVHNNLRLFLSEYSRNPKQVPEVYENTLRAVFSEITSYQSNYIQRISLISEDGMELVATEKDWAATNLRNWYSNDYFRNSINKPPNKVLNNQFHVKDGEAYLYKSVPITMGNKKPVILTLTILMSDILQKYHYLMAANINDQIIAATRHGKLVYSVNEDPLKKEELAKIFSTIKQQSSGAPVLEYGQNVWSYIKNDSQGFYVLFQSKGERITKVLNDEYLKLGIVFFASSFILVLLVFFSARNIQRQASKLESDKVINNQRSHNFASISDEIRQPLNALMGSLVTLEETSEQVKNNTYLDSAKKTALQLSELVNELTDFADISKGDFKLQEIDFDLRTTLNDIADLMSVQAEEKGLDIACLFSSDLPKRIKGDATRLRQIMMNLISFAIKYTDQGEISLSVSLDSYSEHIKQIHIDVSDTGNIIDQQSMLEHFKMFTDPAYYSKNNYAGDGLTLALSSELVGLMDGKISVKENSLGGNTFRVSLPMTVVESVAVEAPKDNLNGKRVLIVGEIDTNRQMLSTALSKWGMAGGTMNEFDHVPKVLQEAKTSGKQYDACLIDISLSSLSEKAFELVKNIRKELDEDSLGIIVLTVQGAPGDAQIAKDLGAQAYLTKPITRNSMKDVLLKIFDRKVDKPTEFVTRHTLKEDEQDKLVRVLVADAEEKSQKEFIRQFDSNKFQVDFAKDGNVLEEAIDNSMYDLVLVDLKLPKVDILSYVKKYRQYENNLNKALNVESAKSIRLPIVAMNKEINADLIKRCEKNGLDNLVPKPITKEHVKYLVDSYMETD